MLCSTTARAPSHWAPRDVSSDLLHPSCGPRRQLNRPYQQEISRISSSRASAVAGRWRIRMRKLAARPCHVRLRRLIPLPRQVPVRISRLRQRSRTRGWRGCLGSGQEVRKGVSAFRVARWTSLLGQCLLWVALKAQVLVVVGYLFAVAAAAAAAGGDSKAAGFLVEHQILREVVVCHLLPFPYSILLELLTRLARFFDVRPRRPMMRWQLAEPGAELPLKA